MRYGILSDIHSNGRALRRVTNRFFARQMLNIDQWILLGDLVGYGPDPAEVLRWVFYEGKDLAYWHIGNHDLLFHRWNIGDHGETPLKAASHAKVSTIYQRNLLRREEHQALVADYRAAVEEGAANGSHDPDRARPRLTSFESCVMLTAHGSPYGENYLDWLEKWYIRPARPQYDRAGAEALLNALRVIAGYAQADKPAIGFVGHSHIQFIASLRGDSAQFHPFIYGQAIPLHQIGEAILVNVGSVGTPRDGDARSAFAILDTDYQGGAALIMQREGYPANETGAAIRDLYARCPLKDTDINMLRFTFGNLSDEELFRQVRHILERAASDVALGNRDNWAANYLDYTLRLREDRRGVEVL